MVTKNKNLTATRGQYDVEDTGRQTYISRGYPGKAGEFLEEQKILLRYNEDDILDSEFLNDLEAKIAEAIDEINFYDKEVLEYGKEVMESALIKYTPVDTGYLLSRWQVTINYEMQSIDVENDCEYAEAQEYGKNGILNGADFKGEPQLGFYPGYYMMHRAFNETSIRMREKQRQRNREIKGKIENGYFL